MKLILDVMCVGYGKYLRAWGWEIIDIESGIADPEIVKIAKEKRAGIITKDKGLERLCEKEEVPCCMVKASIIDEALQVHDNLLRVKNWTKFEIENQTFERQTNQL